MIGRYTLQALGVRGALCLADLSWTAANVRLYGATPEQHTAGGTVARGNLVRKNTSNQIVAASDDSAANADAYGYALNDAQANQPVSVAALVNGGELEGSTFSVGKPYVASTSGATAPADDIAGGEFTTVVGVGRTTARLALGKIAGGVAAAAAVS